MDISVVVMVRRVPGPLLWRSIRRRGIRSNGSRETLPAQAENRGEKLLTAPLSMLLSERERERTTVGGKVGGRRGRVGGGWGRRSFAVAVQGRLWRHRLAPDSPCHLGEQWGEGPAAGEESPPLTARSLRSLRSQENPCQNLPDPEAHTGKLRPPLHVPRTHAELSSSPPVSAARSQGPPSITVSVSILNSY
ncbi:hypothetical protein JZ751_000059 [Albula glossodonta]|uniref:Uncharacterized protein n=1 Tax=Albula glossodonta TaxID=121402 RepID=A0A8T2PV74_9TELE|nr:hypothetical protein JZ751_000059 [Albula glossodonta]